MSQDYHQSIFNFLNGFERSHQDQQQQIRRDKLRVQGFDPLPPLVGIDDEESAAANYETAGMLFEMFNFAPGNPGPTATELLESQILQSYRNPHPAPPPTAADWFLHHRQGMAAAIGGDLGASKNQTIPSINAADLAAAMELFLMNPQQQQQRSPSPSPSNPAPPQSTSSTLHRLLPNPSGAGLGQFTKMKKKGKNEFSPAFYI